MQKKCLLKITNCNELCEISTRGFKSPYNFLEVLRHLLKVLEYRNKNQRSIFPKTFFYILSM